MSLGMGDQRPAAAGGEVLDTPLKALSESTRRGLQQHPVAAAERHPRQLVVAQVLDHGLGHLAALENPDRDLLEAQSVVQRLDAGGDLVNPHIVVVANVRRRANCLDAVRGRLSRHPDAVPQVEGAVVDARKDVAVQVDHRPISVWGCTPRRCKPPFRGDRTEARGYDDRHDPAPAPAGLVGADGLQP